MMIREADQARDDTMEAQKPAETAHERTPAAGAAATQSEQGRREMMERSATPSREARGLWPTCRQRRRQGIFDYAPPGDAGNPAQGTTYGLRRPT
jgi:hypothetical protein